MNGNPVRSCVMPISAVAGARITTIEGLSENGDHPVQKAWIDEALLEKNPNPSDEEIDAALAGNLCRCGTYLRIRNAIHRAANGGR
jgi:aerobic-type carbon monoxide dehydrogenase small subunit (CoxS/CutS family)